MIFFLTVFFASYYVLTLWLWVGWMLSTKRMSSPSATENSLISVIVPVRNEQHNIAALLHDLKHQTYVNFEIVVVDDHSTDSTPSVITKAIDSDGRFQVVKNAGSGKKRALSTGITEAKGTVIVTTDGDCRVPPDWLCHVNEGFQNESVKMLVGPVKIEGEGLFAGMQTIEFSSLIGSGVATLFFGIPTMCNGANLAFRRTAYNDVNGYDDNLHIASGDDEFLMKKIFARYHTGVKFMGLSGTIVSTKPQPNGSSFLQQRIRWAGKWRYDPTPQKVALALYIFLFQFVTMLLPFLAMADFLPWQWALGLWLAKVVLEFLFLYTVARAMKIDWRWKAFVLLQILYPCYVVLVGFACNLQTYTWKERRLAPGKEKTG